MLPEVLGIRVGQKKKTKKVTHTDTESGQVKLVGEDEFSSFFQC